MLLFPRKLLFITLILFMPLAGAHHSAINFDFTKRDTSIEGIVKVFKISNPHTKIILEITDETGTRDILFEGHSRNNYHRSGWRPNMVKEGDRITIQYAPLKSGEDGGYVLGVTTADGKSF